VIIMSKLKIALLPKLLQNVHKAQKKWRQTNYETSIKEFQNEIEQILEILNYYGKWNSKFKGDEIAEKMLPEIFMDGLNSLNLATFGLYKYANMCLRSQLETALRLIYFIDHKREFGWWVNENEWYSKSKQYLNYVWGDDFSYFKQIENIAEFDDKTTGDKKIYSSTSSGKSGDLLKKVYGKLSKSIHTSAQHFQTSTGKFSPKYSKPKMEDWIKTCKDVQCFIIVSVILSFPIEFKKMTQSEQNAILTKGVVDTEYKQFIEEILKK